MSEKKNIHTTSSAAKKSIVAGGLIGTAGFFISKAIGLVYSIPFSTILGNDAYMSYYGSAYRIYSYLLNVFTAGAPMAIATMTAAYLVRKNYRAVLQVRKMSLVVMGLLGALGMLLMTALSAVLAPAMTDGSAEAVSIMTKVLVILSLAVFLVPILSATRGFIQGCKEMKEYAYSQAFEQIFRVAFLLGVSCLLVYGFHLSSVYALYAAVLSTSVAAIAGLIQIFKFSKTTEASLAKEARRQNARAIPLKPLFREFLLLCIPYLLFALIGYINDIYDAILLPIGLKFSSCTSEQIDVMTSAVNYAGIKFTAIPMILAPGFTASIIPHITSALEEKNYREVRKDVRKCINIVLFIAMFLSFAIGLYATPLYYSLFYTSDLALSANTLQWIALEGFFGTITPVVTSMMMAAGLRKDILRQMLIGAIGKGILMVPFVMWWGVAGAVLTTCMNMGWICFYSMMSMHRRFKVSFRSTIRIFVKTLIALGAMALCAWVLSLIGLGNVTHGKMLCFVTMLVSGVLSSVVFVIVALYLRIPQSVFSFRFKKPSERRAAHV